MTICRYIINEAAKATAPTSSQASAGGGLVGPILGGMSGSLPSFPRTIGATVARNISTSPTCIGLITSVMWPTATSCNRMTGIADSEIIHDRSVNSLRRSSVSEVDSAELIAARLTVRSECATD
jgi:hypothetical protein